ncbi:glycosyltransferase [Methylobacterium sp. SyP6R]|uniref:glycosyltransferase n=1 Tax=Methylobacterium sp. SyP6R TaxID=2718876 RepID=UPI001F1E5D0E|nr:glycosyltransferase [Methylobacterium sp. SyP6R]MCF4130235.1 glycosyltransferase [Methylobacterium sp. SyP6R]
MALRVLLIHQTFPSQLVAALEALEAREDVELAGIGMNPYRRPGLRYRQYTPALIEHTGDAVLDDLTTRAAMAAGAAAAARALRYDGFEPDVIVAHPGWGEALYMKDLFPRAKLICYCEYYYLREGGEVNFDPEFPPASPEILHRMRARNAVTLASLEDAEVGVAPTIWQRYTFPAFLHSRIRIVHEGILPPEPPGFGRPVPRREDNVVTFAARHLEPHRGFHTFMRAVPRILQQNPAADIRIIGSDQGGYGAPPGDGRTWKEFLLGEVGGELDPRRVHFLGLLDRPRYVEMLRRTSVHTYLTYPFVLSWSALEAMALGCPMVMSDTTPTRELIRTGDEAEIVDFFDPAALAETVCRLLVDGRRRDELAARGPQIVVERRLSREDGQEAWRQLILSL